MNSVLGIGDNIIFLNKGHKEWVGDKDTILNSENKELNNFVFASPLFKRIKSELDADEASLSLEK